MIEWQAGIVIEAWKAALTVLALGVVGAVEADAHAICWTVLAGFSMVVALTFWFQTWIRSFETIDKREGVIMYQVRSLNG